MSANRIVTDEYSVEANPILHTVLLKGELRLENTVAYLPIVELMQGIAKNSGQERVIIDLRGVEFINSSGINALSKFLMSATREIKSQILVKATHEVLWQSRMLKNIKRVVPEFELEFD